jgi:hypothetical protein
MIKFKINESYRPSKKKMFGLTSSLTIISRTDKFVTYEYGTLIKSKIFLDGDGNECFRFKGYPFTETITSNK